MPSAFVGWLLLALGGIGVYSAVTNKRVSDVFASSLKGNATVKPIDATDYVSGDTTGTTVAGSAGGSTFNSQVPAGSAASQAVGYASAQIGKPYLWGASGPSRFDCSGLTLQAIKAAGGPTLPHNSYAQWVATRNRSLPLNGNYPAGALAFFGTNGKTALIHHVGLCTGGDVMINAPRAGTLVRTDSISARPDLCAVTVPLG